MNLKLSKTKIFLFLLLFIGYKSFGGVNTYVFSQNGSTYIPITGGTVYGNYLSTADNFSNIPIGFNFDFNGTTYSNFGASYYGFIKMGATLPADIYSNNYMLQSGTLNDVIAGFNTELEMGFITKGNYTANSSTISNLQNMNGIQIGDEVDPYGIFFPSNTVVTSINTAANSIVVSNISSGTSANEDVQFNNGELRVQTIGVAPNRICVIQWEHAHYFAEYSDDFNFQVRLFESTNKVAIVYGAMNHFSLDNEVQVGLTGLLRSDFKIRKTATNWNSTTAGTFNNSTCSTSTTIVPASGLTFNFTYCIAPTAPVITASANPSCIGSPVVLSITGGALNSATQWTWRTGSCSGPIVNTGSTYNLTTPSTATNYYVSGTGGCLTAPTPCSLFNLGTLGVPNLSLTTVPSSAAICANESVTLTVTGAGSPNIVWTGGVINGQSFVPAASTVYTVTGTLPNGCAQTLTQAITLNSLSNVVSINMLPANGILCSGQPLTITGSGFATYVWSGGITNGQSFTPATSGSYSVTGTSAIGNCTGTAIVPITVNTLPTVSCIISPNVSTICSNQSVIFSATGANTYSWSGGVTNNVSFFPTATATYTVIGTDGNGCTNTCTKALTVNTAPSVTSSSIPASGGGCFGYSLTLNGAGAASYTWSNGVTNGISSIPTVSNVYTVTGSAANGCTATSTISINVFLIPTITITSIPANSLVCPGNSIVLSGNGANTYTWSGGITNGVAFFPNSSSSYTVTGVSADGCTKTAVKSVTLNPTPSVSITTIPVNTTICFGANATLTATGISNIAWSGGVLNAIAFAPSVTTTYTVSGTNPQGCVGTATKTVIVNQLPNTSINANPSSANICIGSSISLAGAGANTYTWSGGITNNISFSPTATTNYTVTGISAASCSKTASIQVIVNPLPAISAVSNAVNNQICIGGSVVLSGNGGNSYTWFGGVTDNVAFSPTSTTTYTVTGINSNNCAATATITIVVNPLPVIVINAIPANGTVCDGSAIILNATSTNCTFNWSGGISNNTSFIPSASGTFSVTATNNTTGCINTSLSTIIVNSNPIIVSTTIPSTGIICNGESATITVSGAPTISISGNVTNGVAFTPSNTNIYTITATSAQGCTSISTIEIIVNAAANLSIATTPTNGTICFGENATLNATGNSTYNWSNGVTNNVAFTPSTTTTYTVNAVTANGCVTSATKTIFVNSLPIISISTIPSNATICFGNSLSFTASGANTYSWSSGISNGISFIPTTSNTYTVIGTNSNGCTSLATIASTVNTLPLLSISTLPSNPTICVGGNIALTATGANTYTWSNGITNGTSFMPNASSVYTVTGISTNGCSNISTIAVSVNILPNVTASAFPSNATVCLGGSITLNAGGASSYVWSGGVINGQSFIPTNSAVYTVTGSSGIGCFNTATIAINVNSLPSISINSTPFPAIVCVGENMNLNATGTNSIVWSNGVINNTSFIVSSSNIYTATGTDANGCTISATTSVVANALPNIAINTSPSSSAYCFNNIVTLTATGANTFVWSNGILNGIAFNVTSSNIYTVTGTSTDGCIATVTKLISLSSVSASITSIPSIPSLCPSQSIALIGNGGNTYSWTGGVINNVGFVPSATNTYTLTSTDANGCTATSTIQVTINAGATLNVSTLPVNAQVCDGSTAKIIATSNVGITISNGVVNNVMFTPNSTTVYTVTASSGANCNATATVQFTIIAKPIVTANSNPANGLVCTGGNITLTGGGASTYAWSNGVTNGVAFLLPSNGVYTVTGTATNGCTNTDTKSLTVLPVATISISSLPNVFPICTGAPLTLTASGNATSYTWSNGVTNGVSFASTSNTNYIVTATASNGCTSTSVANVTISPMPGTIVLNTIPNIATICLNKSLLLVTTSAGASMSVAGLYNPVITTNAASPQYFYPLANTIYTVTATTGACTLSTTFNVFVKALPVIVMSTSLNNSNVCSGQPVTLTASNSGTYAWSNSISNGVPFVPINSGTYTVTATGANLCVSTATVAVNIVQYPVLSVTTSPAVLPVCGGTPITLFATGAQTYTWSGGVSNNLPFVVNTTTTYTVSGTNANICTSTLTQLVAINNLPNPTINVSPSFSICVGGTAILNAVQPGVTFSWSGGISNNVSFTPVANTIYTLTSTSAAGCISTTTVTFIINNLPNITIATLPLNANICLGASALLTVSGANTYVWQNNNSSLNPIAFSPTVNTTYTVVGTDINGCTASASKSIVVNSVPTISFTPSTPIVNVCAGSTVVLNVTTSNGSIVSNPAITNGLAFVPTTNTIYTITATSTNGCISTITKLLQVNSLPIIGNVPATKSVCQGTGISLSAVSSNTSISWTWPVGNQQLGSSLNIPITANTIFTVTATNNFGCTSSTTVSVTNVVPPIISISTIPANGIVCSGATALLNATGGTIQSWSPTITNNTFFLPTTTTVYTVSVSNGGLCTKTATASITVSVPASITSSVSPGNTICAGNTVTINASATNATLSLAGNGSPALATAFFPTSSSIYTITSTNANGCLKTATQSIVVNASPIISIVSSLTNNQICAGTVFTLTASGTNGFSWTNNSATTSSIVVSPMVNTVYTVAGTNAIGCTTSNTYSINVNNIPSLSVSTTPINGNVCPGLPIAINATSNQSISISGSILNNVNFTPTANGIYTITATSAAGCSISATQAITILPGLASITLTASPNQYNCTGNSYTVTASGAVSYTWANTTSTSSFQTAISAINTNYAVTGTNASGCTKSTNIWFYNLARPSGTCSFTPVSGVVCAGQKVKLIGTGNGFSTWSSGVTNGVLFIPSATATYTMTATGTNGCTKTTTVTMTVSTPAAIVVTNTPANNTVCAGDFLTVNASSAGNTLTLSGAGNSGLGNPFAPAASSIYTITSSNSNACTATTTFAVIVNALPNVIMTCTPSIPVCEGAIVNLSASGAVTYNWLNNSLSGNSISINPTATGVYTVNGVDANNCSATAFKTVTVIPNPIISVSTIPTNASSCPNDLITINASSGNGNSLAISGGVTLGTPFTLQNTTTFTITATNSIGCASTSTITIFINPLPIITITNFPNTASFCENKPLTLTATGADSYVWSNGISNGVSFTTTASNIYTVTGTTNSGCVATATKSITVFPTPIVTIASTAVNNIACFGSNITLTASGAASYAWSFGVTNGVPFGPTSTSVFTVTATSANGCTSISTILITVSRPLSIAIIKTPPVPSVCAGTSVTWAGVSTGSVVGIIGPFGVTIGVPYIPPASSFYTMTATNPLGCVRTQTVYMGINPVPTIAISRTPASGAICAGDLAKLEASGGSTYSWSNGITNNVNFSPTSTATYSVTATGTNGCTASATSIFTVNPLPLITISASSTSITSGQNVNLCAAGANSISWTNGIINCTNFTPTATATYTVTGQDALGCTSTSVITIAVLPSPNSNKIDNNSTNDIIDFQGEFVNGFNQLKWNIVNNIDLKNIKVLKGESIENMKEFASVSASENFNYYFTDPEVANNKMYYQIKATFNNNEEVISNVLDIFNDSKLSLYPNPVVGDAFNIDIQHTNDAPAIIKIISIEGKLLRIINTNIASGKNTIHIDASDLLPGKFILKVFTENKEIGVTQFVKQ